MASCTSHLPDSTSRDDLLVLRTQLHVTRAQQPELMQKHPETLPKVYSDY